MENDLKPILDAIASVKQNELKKKDKAYYEEKEYLEKVASEACFKVDGCYIEPIDEDNVIPLEHFGELKPTNIIKIWLNEWDEMQVHSRETDSNEEEYDMFSEFSNDEMKKILDVCGVKY